MNFSSMFGFVFAVVTLYVCVIEESPNPAALLDMKGFLLVVGGTISAGLVIFPFSKMVELWKFVLFGVILKRRTDVRELAENIIKAATLGKDEQHLLPECESNHPFLQEGFKLIAENQLDPNTLRDVLTKRSQYFKTAYMNDAKMLSILAKFPSSFGMLGSTVGLVDMMSNLGKNGHDGIGPAMALALVATFWGLVFTYMVFMPLADYAARLAGEDTVIRSLIVEGLVMIKKGERPIVILRKLNGFLAIQDRMSCALIELSEDYVETAQQEAAQILKKAA